MNKAIFDEISVGTSSPVKHGNYESMEVNDGKQAAGADMSAKGSSDRLIQSISMIKEILLSNMQLRED